MSAATGPTLARNVVWVLVIWAWLVAGNSPIMSSVLAARAMTRTGDRRAAWARFLRKVMALRGPFRVILIGRPFARRIVDWSGRLVPPRRQRRPWENLGLAITRT